MGKTHNRQKWDRHPGGGGALSGYGEDMKKLILLAILVALGIVAAKKLRVE